MKVLLSWLREFAPLDAPIADIADAFSALGTPVEEETLLGGGLDGIVVARVLSLSPHPQADRIQLVEVDRGDGEALQICCGAFNMAVGDLVPLATLGTVMPDGMEIGRRKMRGEWSNGMLCSAREIGLGDDHGGILILDDVSLGTSISEALAIEPDVLWELEVNPNRPDAMCVAGLARDLAAHFRVPFAMATPAPTPGPLPAIEVENLDRERCGRFTAWLIEGADPTAASPPWMQRRLTYAGMRPVNVLVDISNYVMLELGQPNHPYDLALVPEGKFRIRRAAEGEKLVTLDDVERVLTGEDLLICGGDNVGLGIAGVMGGAVAEVTDSTTTIALEMAWFEPRGVGKTGRRLGLRTEAAARFERGTDPEILPMAAARFAQLAADICGATMAPGFVDARGQVPSSAPIQVRTARINRVLGTEMSPAQVIDLLAPIGFAATEGADGVLSVSIPSWRYDSTSEIDVIEEVARHFGYANIERRRLATSRPGRLSAFQSRRRKLRHTLAGRGLTEVMPTPFLAPEVLTSMGFDLDAIDLRNSLIAEESVLRPTLLPGLANAVALNASRRSTGVSLFEIGHVFRRATDMTGSLLPDEREHLAVALAGLEAPAAVDLAMILLAESGLAADVVNRECPGLHPTRAGHLLVNGESIGVVGEVDPSVLAAVGIDERVAYLEVDLGVLLGHTVEPAPYRAVSKFPSSDVDLAIVVDDSVSARTLAAALNEADDLVWSVDLFDVYRGSGVDAGSRSLAYRVRFVALDRTLTDADVAVARQRLIDAAAALGGILRS